MRSLNELGNFGTSRSCSRRPTRRQRNREVARDRPAAAIEKEAAPPEGDHRTAEAGADEEGKARARVPVEEGVGRHAEGARAAETEGREKAMTHERRLQLMAEQFELAKRALSTSTVDVQNLDHVAALLVLAARVDSLEDAVVNGLPTAGEGL
jgi:hypothetical protein